MGGGARFRGGGGRVGWPTAENYYTGHEYRRSGKSELSATDSETDGRKYYTGTVTAEVKNRYSCIRIYSGLGYTGLGYTDLFLNATNRIPASSASA